MTADSASPSSAPIPNNWPTWPCATSTFLPSLYATEGPLFDSVAGLTFSPDSQHYAYGGHRGNREMIVRDGNFLPEHDGVSPPAFSPDSQHLAYCARDEENTGLVFDSQMASEKFDGSSTTANRISTLRCTCTSWHSKYRHLPAGRGGG